MIAQDHVGKELRQELGNVKEVKRVLNRTLALGKVKKKGSVLHGVAKVRTTVFYSNFFAPIRTFII